MSDPQSAVTTSDVLTTVRAVIQREIARVDDPIAGMPGGDPSDASGWHPYDRAGRPDSRPGRPLYNPESWRWFKLVDVAVLDGTVVVEFSWDEPGTPDLRHLVFVPVARYAARSAELAAILVRSHLRDLLAPLDALASAPSNATPGWRNRVSRTWLDRSLVVVAQPGGHQDQPELDRAWDTA